ncbi:MAG: hypothetical protein HQ596_02440 [Candidatus Saganbacteria bacterium]|nr:hypothetical protein [Candidatus Saganbacteria bacterium]
MKKIIVSVLFLLLVFSLSASALTIQTEQDSVLVPEGTVIYDNLLAAGNTVTILGDVRGDLIVFGQTIIVSGNVSGNIMACGGTIEITGSARNVYIMGSTVAMRGVVSKDLLAGCGSLQLYKSARVGRDVFAGSGSVIISGSIYRNLAVGSGSLSVEPGALVKGRLAYSCDDVDISKDATVLGKVSSYVPPHSTRKAKTAFSTFSVTHKVLAFFATLVLGILIIVFLPNQVKLVTAKMSGHFWKSLGWGIFSLIIIPILAMLLFATVIGIPLAILLLFAYLFGIYIAGIFTSVVIGKLILDRFNKEISMIWAFILGLIIFRALTLIPVVGWIIGLVFLFWAFGALVSTRLVTYKEAREKGIL